jgi:hypothetical protein
MMLAVAAPAARAAFNVVELPSSCPLSSEDDVPLILGTSSLVAMTLLLLLLLLLRLLLLLLRLLLLLLRLLNRWRHRAGYVPRNVLTGGDDTAAAAAAAVKAAAAAAKAAVSAAKAAAAAAKAAAAWPSRCNGRVCCPQHVRKT